MIPVSLNRREFLGTGHCFRHRRGARHDFPVVGGRSAAATARRPNSARPTREKLGWRLCCQLYTFRDRSFYEALEVMAGMGVRRVEPAFFLPLSKEQPDLKTSESLAPDKRREMKQRMNDLGISMPNYYAPIEGDKAPTARSSTLPRRWASKPWWPNRRRRRSRRWTACARNTRSTWRSTTTRKARARSTGTRTRWSRRARGGARGSAPAPTPATGCGPAWTRWKASRNTRSGSSRCI